MPVHADTYLYHDPCHTPLRLNPPLETVKKLTGANVVQSERCCGESGLFAIKRPDIASQGASPQVRGDREGQAKAGHQGHVKMPTTCPGCLQGLSRYEERADMDAEYIVVEMARQILGRQLARPVHPHREERRHREGSRLGTPSLRAAPFPPRSSQPRPTASRPGVQTRRLMVFPLARAFRNASVFFRTGSGRAP